MTWADIIVPSLTGLLVGFLLPTIFRGGGSDE